MKNLNRCFRWQVCVPYELSELIVYLDLFPRKLSIELAIAVAARCLYSLPTFS